MQRTKTCKKVNIIATVLRKNTSLTNIREWFTNFREVLVNLRKQFVKLRKVFASYRSSYIATNIFLALYHSIGPLVRHWTMCYEAKHQHFKQLARVIGNYINICHTLAERYQLCQCYWLLSAETFERKLQVGPGMYICISIICFLLLIAT